MAKRRSKSSLWKDERAKALAMPTADLVRTVQHWDRIPTWIETRERFERRAYASLMREREEFGIDGEPSNREVADQFHRELAARLANLKVKASRGSR